MPRVNFKTKRDRAYAELRGVIRGEMESQFIHTQKELSRRARIDPKTLSKHLKDMDMMRLGELMSIADQLGLKIILSKGGEQNE